MIPHWLSDVRLMALLMPVLYLVLMLVRRLNDGELRHLRLAQRWLRYSPRQMLVVALIVVVQVTALVLLFRSFIVTPPP